MFQGTVQHYATLLRFKAVLKQNLQSLNQYLQSRSGAKNIFTIDLPERINMLIQFTNQKLQK